MSDVYCGVSEPPNGTKRGTAEECMRKRQVRYYGIKSLDKKQIDKYLSEVSKKVVKSKKTVLYKIAKLKGALKKYDRQLNDAKTPADKKKMKDKISKTKSELNENVRLYKQLERLKRFIIRKRKM